MLVLSNFEQHSSTSRMKNALYGLSSLPHFFSCSLSHSPFSISSRTSSTRGEVGEEEMKMLWHGNMKSRRGRGRSWGESELISTMLGQDTYLIHMSGQLWTGALGTKFDDDFFFAWASTCDPKLSCFSSLSPSSSLPSVSVVVILIERTEKR